MRTFVAVYLAVGFVIGFGLLGWIAVASARRHGLRHSLHRAAQTYVAELPLYWRVPVVAWTCLIALPVIAVWAIAEGEWDPVGAAFVALLWLLYLALLKWHHRALKRH